MAEELIGTGSTEAAAAAAAAAGAALASEGTDLTSISAVPEPQPTMSPEDLSAATEPVAENLPGSDFWDEDKTALAQPDPASPEQEVAPEVQEAQAQAEAAQTLKYKANGQDQEKTLEEARKILSQYDGNQKGFQLAAKTQRQLKQLQKQMQEMSAAQERLSQIDALKGDPSGLIEAVTGKSMAEIVAGEVEKHNQYQLASPEERAKMDYDAKQRELEERLARQEQLLKGREDELLSQASEGRKEALNEKFKTAMAEHYSPNQDPTIDNDLREMAWRTSVAKIRGYHKDGYAISDKLINAVFKKVNRSLGTARTANVNQEVAKISADKSAQATQAAQIASTQNYAPSKLPSTKGMNPLEIFENLVRKR
jgi:hypothetical protein